MHTLLSQQGLLFKNKITKNENLKIWQKVGISKSGGWVGGSGFGWCLVKVEERQLEALPWSRFRDNVFSVGGHFHNYE